MGRVQVEPWTFVWALLGVLERLVPSAPLQGQQWFAGAVRSSRWSCNSPRSSPSMRYFAFLRTPSTHWSPMPFLTQRVHGRALMVSNGNWRDRRVEMQ